jgi:hypothetical protein
MHKVVANRNPGDVQRKGRMGMNEVGKKNIDC